MRDQKHPPLNDQQLLRYSRHILLNEFGIEAQEALSQSHALVVGAGGLGSAALLYLATAGVGHITVADGDKVELSNLQRQIVHRESAIGINKAQSAVETLRAINASITLEAIAERLSPADLMAQVANADVVLDCTDNFATRHAINRACVAYRKPLVSGAGIRFDGQITSFDLRLGDSACYHCLFPESLPDPSPTQPPNQPPNQPNEVEERCAIMGVFAPVVGIIGAMQAAEAIRLITGVGEALKGRLSMLDARTMEWQTVKYRRDSACLVCG